MKHTRFTVLAVLILLLIFSVIGWLALNGRCAIFDYYVYSLVIKPMNPALTAVMKVITNIGAPPVYVGLIAVLLALPVTRIRYAIPSGVTLAASAIMNDFILKPIFARPRPDILRLVTETSFSFPSGHAMNSMAFYMTLAIIICEEINGAKKHAAVIAAALLVSFLIGISRIYLGVHYPSDVLGGWVMGMAVAFAASVIRKIEK